MQSTAKIRFSLCNFITPELLLKCLYQSDHNNPPPPPPFQNSFDPILRAGQVLYPKQALKGTRDWECSAEINTPTPQEKSINHYCPYK